MKNTDEKIEQKLNPSNARRKFLVRGTATALIASVPVKVSWAQSANGCMVSGTLSGNQSSTACTARAEGYSDTEWAADDSGLYDDSLNTTWGSVFTLSPQSTDVSREDSFREILTKGAAIDRHLTAGYLNAANGFYPLDTISGVTAVSYAQMLEQEALKNETNLINALQQTYTRGL